MAIDVRTTRVDANAETDCHTLRPLHHLAFDRAAGNRSDLYPNRAIAAGAPHLVVTPNMNHVARLQDSAEFASIYERADLILADGWPVVRLANSLGAGISGRSTGSGITYTLAHMPGEGRRIFLVGGSTPATLEAAITFFRDQWLARRVRTGPDRMARFGG